MRLFILKLKDEYDQIIITKYEEKHKNQKKLEAKQNKK